MNVLQPDPNIESELIRCDKHRPEIQSNAREFFKGGRYQEFRDTLWDALPGATDLSPTANLVIACSYCKEGLVEDARRCVLKAQELWGHKKELGLINDKAFQRTEEIISACLAVVIECRSVPEPDKEDAVKEGFFA